jgi:hypothetical protein
MKRLQVLACPVDKDRAYFEMKIQEASAMGMNYREGLEYVICLRNGGAD